MSTFTLQIITPEKIFFEGEVQRVIVRTTEGDVGILAKHERYVAALPSGPVKVILSDGTERIAALSENRMKRPGRLPNGAFPGRFFSPVISRSYVKAQS